MANVSSPAIRQQPFEHPAVPAGRAPITGAKADPCLRKAIRYSDLVVLGGRVGRPWLRYTRAGRHMVEVGWEGSGTTTTHCLSELTVIRSNDRFACI